MDYESQSKSSASRLIQQAGRIGILGRFYCGASEAAKS